MNLSSSNKQEFVCGVVLVTYNNASEILPCLRSLESAARSFDIQLIIVDNASFDTTPDILRRFHANSHYFADVQLIFNHTNKFFTAAVNQALDLVRAEFVLFLNPDTEVPGDALQRLIRHMRREPDIGVLAPQLRNEDGSIQPSCRRFPTHWNVLVSLLGLPFLFSHSAVFNGWKMGDFDHRSERIVDQPQGAFLLTRAEIVHAIGAWDERYPMFFSDVDWCRKVRENGFKIKFTPEVHVLHHKGRSVLRKRPWMILTSHRSFIHYFWRSFPQWYWFLPNLILSVLLGFAGAVRFICAFFAAGIHELGRERRNT